MAETRYLKCISGFLLPGGRMIRAGDLVTADDSLFKGREALLAHFEPVTQESVEQATRAPGEVRVMGPRRRSSKTKD